MSQNYEGNLAQTARELLRSTILRIERLEEEKKEVGEQIKEVYGEAKARGFDTKALREMIKRRKADPDELREQEAILEVYEDAMCYDTDGNIVSLPGM